MTSQPVEANVVLTTDNSQYDQAMMTSGQSTDALGKSIDSLGQKINQLSKSAGKKLLGITAADVAVISGATAAWSSYEKQMSRLQSQSAILSRTNDQQNRTMKDYTGAVKGLRTEFGTTTSEAAKLVETLSKVTNIRQSRDLADLSKVFVEMSHATGESSEGLASSLTNLQKIMGTPINAKNSRQYADTFTYLSAQTSMSASGLADFTAQLAPMGRSIGMTQKQVAGFATGMTRAGAEGIGASSVFNKIAGDISKSLASGSPEIAHYANLIGVTNERFKKMDGAEQVLRIMESISTMGKQGATELNRLGLDGTRSFRQIQAVINEKGGLREALGMAQDPRAQGAVGRGSAASMKSLNDEFDRLRESMKQTAEAMGSYFMPVMDAFVSGMAKASEMIEKVVEGPLGKFAGMVMGAIAPLAGGAGAMLLFAGALLKIAGAFTLLRNSGSVGVLEGFKGGSRMVEAPGGGFMAAGGPDNYLGKRGAQLATDPRSSWFQRGLYNTGQGLGAGLGSVFGGTREAWMAGRERFDPNYVRPEARRSPFSYAAGGIGRGLQTFVTPAFDQMRYDNPAARQTWLGHMAPWASMQQRSNLSRAMGGVGLAEQQYAAQKAETVRIHQDPMLSNAQRREQLENVRQLRQETRDRINTNKAAETAAREEITSKQALNRETTNTTRGFGRLNQGLGGFAAGMGGGLLGAGKVGFRGLMASGMAGNVAGMGASAALSATGVESNALMGGAMGAMITGGPIGAGVGFAAGAALDAAKANNNIEQSIKDMNAAAADATKSGGGLSDLYDKQAQARKDAGDYSKAMGQTGDKSSFWFGAPKPVGDAFGAGKNLIEGIFGTSDVTEANRGLDESGKKIRNIESASRDLAKTAGVTLTGTSRNQRKQLDDFMSTRGAQMLADAGVDFADLAGASKEGPGRQLRRSGLALAGGGESAYQKLLTKIATQPLDSSVEGRVRGTAGGAMLLDSKSAQKSVKFQDDVGAFYDATNELFTQMKKSGMSNLDILKDTEKTQQNIGDENDRRYEIEMAVSQKAQQALAAQAPSLGRAGAFAQQIAIGTTVMGIKPKTEEQAAQVEQQKATTVQAFQDQDAYFRQMLLAQQAYERSRDRAQQDYNLQRGYQEYDFQLSRSRAEEAFNRSRARAVADYYRSVSRAHYDFNLQRRRQEQDFNHQVEVMSKQQAMSVYNIYERVQAQRTSSASWILSNAGDQLKRMEEQRANLDRLRKMGLSDNVIQQMKLTDPQQAQQLSRFVTELTPQMIRQFNKVAGTQRLKAAKDIVTDPSSLEWQEMRRSFKLNRDRAAEDFERQMKLSRQDFKRGLRQQRQDFNIMMEQQAEDYATSMDRQEKQYKRTMSRAAEDMGHMADEVLGSITDVLTQSSKDLTGAAQKQAQQALKAFKDLRKSTTPEAVALMQELSGVFGFQYKVPKGVTSGGGGGTTMPGGPHISPANRAEGGVMPGYTPGRDIHNVNVSGGEAIMRPEWTRVVGEKNIDAMNHKARYGGFAKGGVVWPLPGSHWSTYPGHDGIDLNAPNDMGKPYYAAVPGRISYVGYNHGYGDAVFETGPYGTLVYGHASKVGVHAGQMVKAGQWLGNVGSTGNSTGPHLHVGFPGGTAQEILNFLHGAAHTGYGQAGIAGPGSTAQVAKQILKDRYPDVEKAAYAMQGVHPLDPGDMSAVINRYARLKIQKLGQQYGLPVGGPSSLGNEPSGNLTNEGIVHVGANRMGWGNQWNALREIVMHESGFRNTAQNPNSSAYGMFQFLDSTWRSVGGHKTADPWLQTQYGLKYIKDRYKDPNGAWRFWQSHNWYGDGAVFDQPQTIGIGEKGPEAVIPLNDRGANFMSEVMAQTMGGRNITPVRGSTNVYNTAIDRSTNFTGPITVQANDPQELIHKLQARQRVMALSRPSLTGSAA